MPPALNERFIQNEIELQIEDEFTESAQVTSITDESNKQMNTLVIIKKKKKSEVWMNEWILWRCWCHVTKIYEARLGPDCETVALALLTRQMWNVTGLK